MRKQTMKVYHGIPKSITDEHTLFYESCDGKLDNSYTVINPISFYPNVTGYGVYGTTIDEFNFVLTTECNIQTKVFTVDFWATMKTPVNSSYAGRLFEITFNNNSNYKIRLEKDSSNDRFHLWENANLVYGEFDFSSANVNKPHHFRIIFKVGDYCKMYIDGKEPNIVHYQNKLTTSFEYISHIRLCGANFSVSDFHISNIDRGDYFPNLPQDFIEGKAIIKPRMGQQQIKGDPMYSQTTLLKVPCTRDNSGWDIPIDNNMTQSSINPEVSVTSSNFINGEKIKIKGLNGEVIGGVIDSDTALCNVIKAIADNHLVVDSVSKLNVGDIIRGYNSKLQTPDLDSVYYTISEVNTSNNSVKITNDYGSVWSQAAINDGWTRFIEITVSSSTPIVKTQDGVTVVGTWSGLGTTQATFTLGENSDIAGKDLYVEYSLTMPYGNSDFPELPYEVERAWGENGVEMKPKSNIIICDDFKGKVLNDNTECPHFMGWNYGISLQVPNTFLENDKQDYYNFIMSQDSNIRGSETSTSGHIPQHLFRFNLVEIVERKFGIPIPAVDKISWLKDNISYVGLRWYGYGVNYLGNKAQCEVYLCDTNAYTTTGKSNTTSTSSLCQLDVSSSVVKRIIDTDGNVNFIAYTTASDGTTRSVIITDYVVLDLIVSYDSTYTVLYCDNIRSREDECNPVLVQKETKTVKRLLPSKECFTTESTKHSYKDNVKTETGEILYVSPNKVVTTNGTTKLTQGNLGVDNYTDKIVLPSGYNPYNFDSSPIRVSETDESYVSHTVQLPIIRYWGGRKHHGVGAIASGLDSCQTTTTVTDKEGKQQYEMYAGLKNVNNELKMVIRTDVRLPNNNVPPSTYTNRDYKLPNRPLIK